MTITISDAELKKIIANYIYKKLNKNIPTENITISTNYNNIEVKVNVPDYDDDYE